MHSLGVSRRLAVLPLRACLTRPLRLVAFMERESAGRGIVSTERRTSPRVQPVEVEDYTYFDESKLEKKASSNSDELLDLSREEEKRAGERKKRGEMLEDKNHCGPYVKKPGLGLIVS